MVARLLSLEDAEKQRGYKAVDEILKYPQDHSPGKKLRMSVMLETTMQRFK